MTKGISERELSRLSDFIAERMGLRFPKERWRNLERGINAAAHELSMEDGKSCIDWLLSSSPARSQIEILAGHLTVGETYFFRDKRLFTAIEKSILSELILLRRNNGRRIRIWSAGCSSGEEPYSIAILLSKMIPDIEDWNITILATDINTRFLRKAADGVYGNWSFRDIRPGIKEGFFNRRKDGRFEILPRIREMVTFSYLNLVEDAFPSIITDTKALDIIFCRNVLMYFVPEFADKVVRNFYRSLVDGGFLIVSPSESFKIFASLFTTIRSPGAILYKKKSRQRANGFTGGSFEKPKSTPEPAFNPVPAAAPLPKPADMQIIPQFEGRDPPVELPTSNADGPDRKDLYLEASALYRQGCFPEAVEKTEKLLSQSPSDADGLVLLARIYADSGKLDKALEWCEKAIFADKLHAGCYYLMAIILQELGRTEEAVASLKKTLYLDPNFVLAHVALGNISRKSGKRKESVKHFKNALRLLNSRRPEDIPPESEGINAERLALIIKTMQRTETGR